ncbi:MAG: aldo/keto reductase [Planctomycetes bacterium]|nr:aldo/keto reductase [Planctomycetota bacterium]
MQKLGFGAMRLPLTEAGNVQAIDQDQVNRMADVFLDNGFTYFDTAYPYHEGTSEAACRQALVERKDRSSFLLADKMPTFLVTQASDYDRFFTEEQERCGVDHFDYYLLHNLNARSYRQTRELGGFAYVRKLQEQGRAGRIGFSFHDKADLLETILAAHPEMEFVQLQINYVDWDSEAIQSRRCYEIARKYDKPIIVMEPLKGGGLVSLPEEAEQILKAVRPDRSIASWALRFAASLEGVITVLSGMSSLAQTVENVAVMKDFQPLDSEERAALARAAESIGRAMAVPCTNCRYCIAECPQAIDIPALFSVYNNLKHYGNRNFPAVHYANMTDGRARAGDCIGCRGCENACPQHLAIADSMRLVAEAFES